MSTTPRGIVALTASALCLLFSAASATTTINYDPTAAGTSGKGIPNWSYDVKNAAANPAGDMANSGASYFDSIRVAWYPQYAYNGTLAAGAKSDMDNEIALAGQTGIGNSYFLSPKTGTIDPSFVNSDGTINVTKWVNAMQDSRDYYKGKGKTIAYNGATNEGDNTGGKFTASIFVNIRNAMSGWTSTQVGPCCFKAADSASWLPTIHNTIGKATTHVIGGSTLADYKSFNTTASGEGLDRWNSEIHQLAEALVGANLGFHRGIWWGAITPERGNFIKFCNNNRNFYHEIGTWCAAGCYAGNSPQNLWIFIGNKESTSETITFTSSTIAVHYDTSPLQQSVTVTVPAGGEQMIHVTW